MILFIYLCILILNIVAVLLTYHFLGTQLGKKEKWIFIAIGIAVMYLLVTSIYWLSTKQVNLGEAANPAQNLITFTFVPVNSILILPFLANSYQLIKRGKLDITNFKKRAILLAIILFIVLLFEFFYFKDIQIGILSIIQNSVAK